MIDARTRETAAIRAASLLTSHVLFMQSENIACYLAADKEFDVKPIIETIWRTKKNCYVPVINPEPQNHFEFFLYQDTDELIQNKYGIWEPLASRATAFTAEELDLVLVPLVGFDLSGNRLGAGGGYYDRAFSFLNREKRKEKPFLLGVGFAMQQVNHIETDPWDITLNGVLTESSLILFPL